MTATEDRRPLRIVWDDGTVPLPPGDWLLRSGATAHPRDGLNVLLDFDLSHALAQPGLPPVFAALPEPSADPRAPVHYAPVATALVGDAAAAEALASWAAAAILALPCQGVRLLGLEQIPATLLPLVLTALRRATPGRFLFAWTAGLSRAAMEGLPPGALDA